MDKREQLEKLETSLRDLVRSPHPHAGTYPFHALFSVTY